MAGGADPDPRKVVDCLGEKHSQPILRSTVDEPKHASNLIEDHDVPRMTFYRRVDRLAEHNLIEEHAEAGPRGALEHDLGRHPGPDRRGHGYTSATATVGDGPVLGERLVLAGHAPLFLIIVHLAYVSYRAYRAGGDVLQRNLAVAFLLVTVGVSGDGFSREVLGVERIRPKRSGLPRCSSLFSPVYYGLFMAGDAYRDDAPSRRDGPAAVGPFRRRARTERTSRCR